MRICEDLDAAIQVMKFRQLPNQYIPDDEGDAPILDFKIDCTDGDAAIGANWSGKATDDQKDAPWP